MAFRWRKKEKGATRAVYGEIGLDKRSWRGHASTEEGEGKEWFLERERVTEALSVKDYRVNPDISTSNDDNDKEEDYDV